MKINLNPSEKELNEVFGLKVLIDSLNSSGILKPNGGILCKSEKQIPKRKWVIVKLNENFSFPIQIPNSKTNQVSLYTFDKQPVLFSEENACFVLVMYFYSMLWFLWEETRQKGIKEELTNIIEVVTTKIYSDPVQLNSFKKLREKAIENLRKNGVFDDAIYVLD
jgi:hypothetical protein